MYICRLPWLNVQVKTEVVSSGAGVYYVKDVPRADDRRYEVLHVGELATQHKSREIKQFAGTGQNAFIATTTLTRVNMYKDKTIRQPEAYTGKYVGPEDLLVLRSVQCPVKRGRPKTARYKSKRRTVKDVVTSRVYRIIKILDSPEI